jgi:hypothetical protein
VFFIILKNMDEHQPEPSKLHPYTSAGRHTTQIPAPPPAADPFFFFEKI